MSGSSRARKPEPASPPKREKAPNITLRITPETREGWKFWCEQMRMTYEESIQFLMEHHPVEIRVPKGVKVKTRAD